MNIEGTYDTRFSNKAEIRRINNNGYAVIFPPTRVVEFHRHRGRFTAFIGVHSSMRRVMILLEATEILTSLGINTDIIRRKK